MEKTSTFTDTRDLLTYRIARLRDGRWWFTENFRHDSIESTIAAPDIGTTRTGTDPDYSPEKYGRLYSLKAAIASAPPGWHVPSIVEWETLVSKYGGKLSTEIAYTLDQPHYEQISKALVDDGFSLMRGGIAISMDSSGRCVESKFLGSNCFATFLCATAPRGYVPWYLKPFMKREASFVWFVAFSQHQAFLNPENDNFWFSVRYIKDA